MEEAAGDVSSRFKLTRSVDERHLKINHQSDRTVEDGCAPFPGDLLNKDEEALVDLLVLSSHKAVEDGVGDAFLEQRMEHVELCERENDTSERPVTLDERRL